MSMDFWNNFWTALGVGANTVISFFAIKISLKAIKQTEAQIELSNKQQLFEKRLKAFNDLVSLKGACLHTLNKNISIISSSNLYELLKGLTLSYFFENFSATLITENDNNEDKKKLLKKTEGQKKLLESSIKLGDLSKELPFLFESGAELESATQFISAYQETLVEIFHYYDNEKQYRNLKMLQQKYLILKQEHQKMIDLKVEEKLKKSIKLF